MRILANLEYLTLRSELLNKMLLQWGEWPWGPSCGYIALKETEWGTGGAALLHGRGTMRYRFHQIYSSSGSKIINPAGTNFSRQALHKLYFLHFTFLHFQAGLGLCAAVVVNATRLQESCRTMPCPVGFLFVFVYFPVGFQLDSRSKLGLIHVFSFVIICNCTNISDVLKWLTEETQPLCSQFKGYLA